MDYFSSDWVILQIVFSYILTGLQEGSKGRLLNSLPLTTNFSQNDTDSSEGISYPVGDLC